LMLSRVHMPANLSSHARRFHPKTSATTAAAAAAPTIEFQSEQLRCQSEQE
jgi:hypothetical protein